MGKKGKLFRIVGGVAAIGAATATALYFRKKNKEKQQEVIKPEDNSAILTDKGTCNEQEVADNTSIKMKDELSNPEVLCSSESASIEEAVPLLQTEDTADPKEIK